MTMTALRSNAARHDPRSRKKRGLLVCNWCGWCATVWTRTAGTRVSRRTGWYAFAKHLDDFGGYDGHPEFTTEQLRLISGYAPFKSRHDPDS
jgi:hypothetical protein